MAACPVGRSLKGKRNSGDRRGVIGIGGQDRNSGIAGFVLFLGSKQKA